MRVWLCLQVSIDRARYGVRTGVRFGPLQSCSVLGGRQVLGATVRCLWTRGTRESSPWTARNVYNTCSELLRRQRVVARGAMPVRSEDSRSGMGPNPVCRLSSIVSNRNERKRKRATGGEKDGGPVSGSLEVN